MYFEHELGFIVHEGTMYPQCKEVEVMAIS